MMSEIDANQPAQEQSRSSYGGYEGQQRSSAQPAPPYEMGYQQPAAGGTLDDNFVEAVSQRIVQQMGQQSRQSTGKVYGRRSSSSDLPAGLRGAIAIVSVCVLVPIGIVLGQQGLGGLLALGIVGVVILSVNAIANGVLSSRD